jgi:predicted O-linked N-acetylglucosamine transferase (SPINDLY family)
MTFQQAFDLAVRHHKAGQLEPAAGIYRQILAQQPGHADALHMLGVISHQMGRNDMAVNLIRQAIAINPNWPESHNNLGNALSDRGQLEEAAAAYRQAITLKPNYPVAHSNLGVALKAMGQLDAAVIAYRQAIALKPDYPEAHYNLGNALKDQGQFDAAIAAYRQAIVLKPNYPEAWCNFGIALKAQGQLDAAIAAYRQALALKPKMPEVCNHLGNALRARGELKEAISAFHQALALYPSFPEARNNLGNALNDQGQRDAAIAAYRQAIAMKPDYAEAYSNLANALRVSGQLDQAVAACRQAVACNPNLPEAHNNLGTALKDQGELDAALAAFRQAVALAPDNAMIHSNLVYALHFHPGSDAQTLAGEHRRWNLRHAGPLQAHIPSHTNDRHPDRRLKIGYVSPDFRAQAESFFTVPLLEQHDHAAYEIHCYSSVIRPDQFTARLRQLADVWRDVPGVSDAALASIIRQDGIDILVDLTMHMAHSRLLLFARKPAPVQVTYLAYCSSTGLEAIDYRLSDPYLDPPGGDESVYSERTMRLPETYWCYQPMIAPPEIRPLPAVAQGHITFGCLNNFCKVSAPALAAWARLLRAVPNSQLLLHAHEGSHRQRLQERLAREGIEAHRVEFAGFMPIDQYFALYQRIDLALDTFPYGGGTTTCDALWMGVPVVSLAGQTAVGRGGLSLLSNIGLRELVAWSEEEYVGIAAALAGDLPRLSNLRATLRRRMEQSPLMDAPRFARGVEAAYRQMWRQWCAQTPA